VNRFAPKDCIVEINMIALQDNSQIKKETIIVSDVPRPDIHQPHAVRAGDFVFLSGIYATDFTGGLAPEARLHPEMPWFGSSAKKQTDYILKNMAGVCRGAGTHLKNVVWTQNFYTDLRDFYPSLEVWQQYFPEDPPASFVGAVKTPQLIPDCTILFDAVAVVTD
jgi:enamine deaminase RidA (YjgF/YER057c/UK114 family)